jgi:thiol-disulfide isomerase/thioredoxin
VSSRAVILALVVLLFGAVGFLLLSTTSVHEGGVRVMQTPVAAASCHEDDCLPEFRAVTLDGQEISHETLRGKTVLVNFWATWCKPCVHEIPALEAFYKAHQHEDLVVLGIATDRGKSEAEVKAFLAAHGASYPNVLSNAAIERSLGAPGVLPTSFLYGADGHLRQTFRGALTTSQLEAARLR